MEEKYTQIIEVISSRVTKKKKAKKPNRFHEFIIKWTEKIFPIKVIRPTTGYWYEIICVLSPENMEKILVNHGVVDNENRYYLVIAKTDNYIVLTNITPRWQIQGPKNEAFITHLIVVFHVLIENNQ